MFLIKFIEYIYIRIKNSGKLYYPFSSQTTKKSSFEGCNRIYHKSFFSGNMGYGSYMGEDCYLVGNIGRFTSIASHVRTNLGIHPNHAPFATTCPMFFSVRKQNGHTFASYKTFEEFVHPLEIGNDCWIGENVFICGNVKIGDGAIVYAGSVVSKDVPPYAIVAGVPAKVIRYRFDEETVSFLNEIKWWNMPVSWLKSNWQLLNNIDELKKYFTCRKNSSRII